MSFNLVVWAGPVDYYQVRGATVPGAKIYNPQCTSTQIPHCPTIGDSYLDSQGRRLPSLIQASGNNSDDVENVYLGAFSAGGSIVWRLLENPEDRKQIKAIHLADATYTDSWADEKNRIPQIYSSWVDYCVEVATGSGDQVFVATASTITNRNWASGVENLQELRRQVELRTGLKFEKIDNFFGIFPQPKDAYRLGNVILAEYQDYVPGGFSLGHNHWQIAPQVWKNIILATLELKNDDIVGVPPVRDDDIIQSSISDKPKYTSAIAFTVSSIFGYLLFSKILNHWKKLL